MKENFYWSKKHNIKKTLIANIIKQDGSYLAEFLLNKDSELQSPIRRAGVFTTGQINHLYIKNLIDFHEK